MKKNLFAGAAIAALALAATSCSDPAAKKTLVDGTDINGVKYTSEIVDMGNEAAQIMGTYQGANDHQAFEQHFIPTLRTELDAYHAEKFDEKAFMEGMRAGMMSDTTNFSYRYGYQQGLMMRQHLDVFSNAYDIPLPTGTYLEAYAKALKNGMSDEESAKLQERGTQLDMELQARKATVDQMRIEKARKANTKAAEEKKAALLKEGYKELPSGVIYKVEKEGAGAKVTRDDVVTMNYVGKHLDGKEFDSSNGEPINSPVRMFVPGYQEALQLLGKGGKVIVYIPGELAYGELGQPRAGIGPNEMLMFEIEVVDIAPVEKPEDADATEALANASENVRQAAAIAAQNR